MIKTLAHMGKQLGFGIMSFIPGLENFGLSFRGSLPSARYCYSVWMRHLVMAKQNDLNTSPKIVAEFGPGNTLGVGLAALLSGSEKYYALDVIKHANKEYNLKIFNDLVSLFRNKTPIPDDKEFPEIKPYLDDYRFPDDIFDNKRLDDSLNKERLLIIKQSIENNDMSNSAIQYIVPWSNKESINKSSIDMIFSQAVMEHIDELSVVYDTMEYWLQPKGFISHQIDLKSHGLSVEWNGHWKYSKFLWSLIKGKRSYLINREPHSTHISLIQSSGFNIICNKRVHGKNNLKIDQLYDQNKFVHDDLEISGVFIQAVPCLITEE